MIVKPADRGAPAGAGCSTAGLTMSAGTKPPCLSLDSAVVAQLAPESHSHVQAAEL